MLQDQLGRFSFHIPNLDRIVARRASENVLRRRIEQYVANFPALLSAGPRSQDQLHLPRVTFQLAVWRNVLNAFWVLMYSETFRHLPQHDFAIVRSRRDQLVVERAPVRIEHRRGMSSEQWNEVRQLSLLFNGYNSERATTTCFPVDCDIFWVRLDNVTIPRVLGYAQVVVALFLFASLTEYMSVL